ncbi:MAG: HAD family phosphatase [Bdellovibrio sp.]|nr:HAD family phosphatase [Bdellovibrio sp.]
MQKSKIQTVLFDFDGTIVDTEPSAVKVVKACFKEWKLELTPEDASYVTGRTWESAFDYLLKKYSLPLERNAAEAQVLSQYRTEVEKNLIQVPGSVQAIRSLSKHFTLGLVSGSIRQDILEILSRLGLIDLFKVILGASDYEKSKPAPDGYLKAAQILGAAPASCLVFEDSEAGVKSGKKAGMWVVAITSTNHFGQDLSQADFHIPDLRQVNPDWVSHLSVD